MRDRVPDTRDHHRRPRRSDIGDQPDRGRRSGRGAGTRAGHPPEGLLPRRVAGHARPDADDDPPGRDDLGRHDGRPLDDHGDDGRPLHGGGRGSYHVHDRAPGDVGHEGVGLPRDEGDRRGNDARRRAARCARPRRRARRGRRRPGCGRRHVHRDHRRIARRRSQAANAILVPHHQAQHVVMAGARRLDPRRVRCRDRVVGVGGSRRRADRARGAGAASGVARSRHGRLHRVLVRAVRRTRLVADAPASPDPPRPGARRGWCDLLDPRRGDGRPRCAARSASPRWRRWPHSPS